MISFRNPLSFFFSFFLKTLLAHGPTASFSYLKTLQLGLAYVDANPFDFNVHTQSQHEPISFCVEASLKSYASYPIDICIRGHRVFDDGFLAQYKLKETRGDNDQELFLCRRRMVAFVDRRSAAKSGHESYDAWLFEPPSDCNEIPDNAVPEWFINASQTTLLPHFGYRMARSYLLLEAKAMANKKNVSSHFFGSLLTLSFFFKSPDVVKCYLYWHGSEDIRTTLTKIFDLEKCDN